MPRDGNGDRRMSGQKGITAWLTGLPSAGKSTIARAVAARLRAEGRRVQVLDGDELRRDLTRDLGFGREDREENVRRIGFVARLLSANGIITVVPVIAPYAASRAEVRSRHESEGVAYAEIYVATPVTVCATRDVKGLYARQRAGELHGLTGVDDPYEPPSRPDLVIPTQDQTVTASVDAVHTYLRNRLANAETVAALR